MRISYTGVSADGSRVFCDTTEKLSAEDTDGSASDVYQRAGTAGDDVIVGRGGKDTIKGLGGNDVLCGSGGNDTIRGGGGNDMILAGLGNDTARGDGDADSVKGQGGKDRLAGGPSAGDSCDGGPGMDALLPNAGCETVVGVP